MVAKLNSKEVKGYQFTHSILTGPYSSLARVDIFRKGAGDSLKRLGRQRILGIAHTTETVRVGLFRRKIATLRFDPVASVLSIEE